MAVGRRSANDAKLGSDRGRTYRRPPVLGQIRRSFFGANSTSGRFRLDRRERIPSVQFYPPILCNFAPPLTVSQHGTITHGIQSHVLSMRSSPSLDPRALVRASLKRL